MRITRLLPVLALAAGCLAGPTPLLSSQAWAQEAPEEAPAANKAAFPLTFRVAGRDLTLHEPQVLAYDGATDATTLRFAAELTDAVGRKGYGSIEATAVSRMDIHSRLVRADDLTMTGGKLPSVGESDRTAVLEALPKEFPKRVLLRLELYTCRPGAPGPQVAEPKFPADPPKIFVRRRPAVLVQIDGEPQMLPVQSFPIEYVGNSASDIFHKPSDKKWWLLIDGYWAESPALEGPWKWLEGRLPVELSQLRVDHARGHVRQFMPGTPEYGRRFKEKPAPPPEIPDVLITKEPAELVLLKGDPLFTLVSRTVKLMSVANTECDLLFHPKQGRYYVLLSGRWFVADDLLGTWKPAYGQVPEEFAEIPRNHRLAHVLHSVPGTPEAAEAVALAALEERATLKTHISINVRHVDKSLRSAPTPGSKYKHCTSCEDDIFQAGGGYLACANGAWLLSEDGVAGFKPATEIPEDLRKLSAGSGYYHAGFVRPAGATEDGVTFAMTSGFLGVFVRQGLPVHGTGWPGKGLMRNNNWYPAARTYGESRWYDIGTGVFQPRTVKYDEAGNPVASEWSPYTASYGRVDEYADRYEQGGRRMFQFNRSKGTFELGAGRPDPYSDWGDYAFTRNGIPSLELPLGDRRTETVPEQPTLVGDADGNVFRPGEKGVETWKDGAWTAAGTPAQETHDWVRVFERIDRRPADRADWAAKRRAPRPVNPVVSDD